MAIITRRAFTYGLVSAPLFPAVAMSANVSAAVGDVRAIAKEAYIYGYPMVDGYRILNAYFVNKDSPEYRGEWNQLFNTPRVYTPDDKAVQTPNSDTPYSMIGLDLRTEPMVLTVPAIEKDRYFSIQLIDLYTYNFDYIGSRTTGNEGGSYLIAGPGWSGETPAGITKVIRSETELVLGVYRTQLFSPDDLENVKKVQAGYKAEPLSKFMGIAAPTAAPVIEFPKPLSQDVEKSSVEVFNILNFLLGFSPPHSSENELMARFATIGVGPGIIFDSAKLSPETKTAMEHGISDAWTDVAELKKKVDAKKVTSGDMFGTRELLNNNYLYRMVGAIVGIYANSKAEAMYPFYGVDAEGQKLNGANKYVLRFEPGELPPVKGFWSLTMYELPASLLYANPLKRYLLNKPMMPQFKKDADGGLTFYIQNESPGNDKEGNWLPAPNGPFFMAMRLYWPEQDALDGKWIAPVVKRN